MKIFWLMPNEYGLLLCSMDVLYLRAGKYPNFASARSGTNGENLHFSQEVVATMKRLTPAILYYETLWASMDFGEVP